MQAADNSFMWVYSNKIRLFPRCYSLWGGPLPVSSIISRIQASLVLCRMSLLAAKLRIESLCEESCYSWDCFESCLNRFQCNRNTRDKFSSSDHSVEYKHKRGRLFWGKLSKFRSKSLFKISLISSGTVPQTRSSSTVPWLSFQPRISFLPRHWSCTVGLRLSIS